MALEEPVRASLLAVRADTEEIQEEAEEAEHPFFSQALGEPGEPGEMEATMEEGVVEELEGQTPIFQHLVLEETEEIAAVAVAVG